MAKGTGGIDSPDAGLALSYLIRSCRERAGDTYRLLAERMQVSRATLREAESGRDVRHSTLLALGAALPELSPPRVLGTGAHRTPPTLPRAWQRLVELHGLSMRKMSVRFDYSVVGELVVRKEFEGLKNARVDEDPERILRRIFPGSPKLLAEAIASGLVLQASASQRVELGDIILELDVPRRKGGRWRLAWTRRLRDVTAWRDEHLDPHDGLSSELVVEVDIPAESLVLELIPPSHVGAVKLSGHSWPAALAGHVRAGSHVDEWRMARGGKLVLSRALPGFSHALTWRPAVAAKSGIEPAPQDMRLATVLRSGREASGLSCRALARLMGTSAQVISAAENGSDPRHSTLLSYAAALPALSSWALLAEASEACWVGRHWSWEYLRDLHGVLVEEEHKEVVISPRGSLTMRIHSRGLKSLSAEDGDLLVRLGAARQVVRWRAAELEAVEAGRDEEAGLRIRRLNTDGSAEQHILRIPAGAARRGVDVTRRFVSPGAYIMRAAKARRLTGSEGPFHLGNSFGTALPCRTLRLSLQFPVRHWPEDLHAQAWSAGEAPDPEREDRAQELHPEGLDLELNPASGRAELRVDRPLPGFKYSISWRLP